MPGSIEYPLFTWNLFVTVGLVPLCVLVLGMFIKRWLDQKDKKDAEIHRLRLEADSRKENSVREWREAYVKNQCDIKKKLEEIGEELHNRVTWDHCKHEMDRFDDRLRDVNG